MASDSSSLLSSFLSVAGLPALLFPSAALSLDSILSLSPTELKLLSESQFSRPEISQRFIFSVSAIKRFSPAKFASANGRTEFLGFLQREFAGSDDEEDEPASPNGGDSGDDDSAIDIEAIEELREEELERELSAAASGSAAGSSSAADKSPGAIDAYYSTRAETAKLRASAQRESAIMQALQVNPNVKVMEDGGIFYRYLSGQNTRHPIYLWFERGSDGLGCVYWNESIRRERVMRSGMPDHSHTMYLDQLSDIFCGKQEVFDCALAAEADDRKCFSLVSGELVLNLETNDDPMIVTHWLSGLQFILESLGSNVVLADEAGDENNENDEFQSNETQNNSNYVFNSGLAYSPQLGISGPGLANDRSSNPAAAAVSSLSNLHANVNFASNPILKDSEDETPERCGILTKLGGTRKNWKKRVFKLVDGSLRYYVPKEGEPPNSRLHKRAGSIFLPGASLAIIKPEVYGRPCAFAISPFGGNRTYVMEAPNEAERSDWMKALEKYIKEKKKIEPNGGSSGMPQIGQLAIGGILSKGQPSNSIIQSPSVPVFISGCLKKKGENHNRWSVRFFKLYRNGQLEYYTTNQQQTEPVKLVNSVSSIGCSVSLIPSEFPPQTPPGYKFSFTPARSTRCYMLESDDEAERQRWVNAFASFQSTPEDRADPESILEGYLTKEAGRVLTMKPWQERYFILSKYWLKYFKSKGDLTKPLGQIPLLADCVVQNEPFQNYKKDFAFSLTPSVGKNVRKYVMLAADEQTRVKWVEQISAAVNSRKR